MHETDKTQLTAVQMSSDETEAPAGKRATEVRLCFRHYPAELAALRPIVGTPGLAKIPIVHP